MVNCCGRSINSLGTENSTRLFFSLSWLGCTVYCFHKLHNTSVLRTHLAGQATWVSLSLLWTSSPFPSCWEAHRKGADKDLSVWHFQVAMVHTLSWLYKFGVVTGEIEFCNFVSICLFPDLLWRTVEGYTYICFGDCEMTLLVTIFLKTFGDVEP